jgi:hypothetical protein
VVLPVLSKDDICNVCNWHIKDALDQTIPTLQEENIDDFITHNGNLPVEGDQD